MDLRENENKTIQNKECRSRHSEGERIGDLSEKSTYVGALSCKKPQKDGNPHESVRAEQRSAADCDSVVSDGDSDAKKCSAADGGLVVSDCDSVVSDGGSDAKKCSADGEVLTADSLRYESFGQALQSALLGFFIGIAVIVPGVSGSTVAVIMKLYEKLLYALGNLLHEFKRCFLFLLPVAVGVLAGFVLGFFAVRFLLELCPFAVIALFAGLMVGAFPAITDEIRGAKRTPLRVGLSVLGLVVSVGICVLSLFVGGERTLGNVNILSCLLFLALGFAVAVTQIVPGLSATALLMAAGYFNPLMQSVGLGYWQSNPQIFAVYACLGIGFIFGLLVCSKGMSVLLERRKHASFFAIVGLSAGVVATMFFNPEVMEVYRSWTQGTAFATDLVLGIVLLAAGIAVGYWFVRAERKRHTL